MLLRIFSAKRRMTKALGALVKKPMMPSENNPYISGEQLYQYLHISKRKMKYLLENGYIPCVDTGKPTHRYIIKKIDAEAFKRRLLEDPGLLSETYGLFSTNDSSKRTPPNPPLIPATAENSKKFKQYLIQRWKHEPDALSDRRVAELVGYQQQGIFRLCEKGEIFGVKIANKRYCSKESVILYFSSQAMLAKPYRTEVYTALIKDFMLTQ